MAATAANHGGRAVVPAASGAARTRWSQWDRKEREAGRVQAERRYGVGGGDAGRASAAGSPPGPARLRGGRGAPARGCPAAAGIAPLGSACGRSAPRWARREGRARQQ